MSVHDTLKYLFELTLLNKEIDLRLEFICRIRSVNISQILRDHLVKYQPADSSLHYAGALASVRHGLFDPGLYHGVKGNFLVFICKDGLVHTLEYRTLSLSSRPCLSKIVDTKYHIL